MSFIKLPVEIKSYWCCKRFNTIYFDGLTKDNLISNNTLIIEKNTRIKIHFNSETSDIRTDILIKLHQSDSWVVNFKIDPFNSTSSLDKDGNKVTIFKTQNADYLGGCSSI